MYRRIFFLILILFICKISISQTWQQYDSLRAVYFKSQNYDSALTFSIKALNAVKEKYGEHDSLYVDMISRTSIVYYYLKDYSKTIEYLLIEKDIRAKNQGTKNPNYAEVVQRLGYFYGLLGDEVLSEQMYIEALNIKKEIYGENDPNYLNSLNSLAVLYKETGRYKEAEPLFLKTITARKETLGDKHPQYANSLFNLGALYYAQNNYKSAEPIFLELLNIHLQVSGTTSPEYLNILNILGMIYQGMEDYDKALSFYIDAKDIRKEVLGEKHPDYITSLTNLALLYWDMGEYSKSESLNLEAVNISKQVLGEFHPSYALALNNLAGLYCTMGNELAAEKLMLDVVKINKQVYGEKHVEYAQSITNLAVLYKNMGNYPKSLNYLMESKNIYKETDGGLNLDYAKTLFAIAQIYRDMAEYSVAEPLFNEAIKINKEILGENNSEYGVALGGLAELFRKTGKFESALNLYTGVLKIFNEAVGEKQFYYDDVLNNIALVYESMGKDSFAESFLIKCVDLVNKKIDDNFSFLSEKEKEMYFKRNVLFFDHLYAFTLKRRFENKDLGCNTYNNIVKNKGRLLKSSTLLRTLILNSQDTLLISQYENWIGIKKEISKLYSIEISKRNKNLEELEEKANLIEKDLVRSSQMFNDFKKSQNLTWESVKNSLKKGEVAIEFLHFTEGKNKDTITYCALLITSESKQPEIIRLFEEKEIQAILNLSSGNNYNFISKIYGTKEITNEALYKLIWQPLEPYLTGIKTVYYSPDGILHKVSFAAMGKGKNIYLCDNYNLQQVSSTGKMVMPESTIIDKNMTACIIGGINYNTDTVKEELWNYLPGTLTEMESIKNRLEKKKVTVTCYSGKEATELSFKNIYGVNGSNPEILHIATHGFFYPDPEQIQKEEKAKTETSNELLVFRGGSTGFGLWQFVKNKNPLMRSGLVFAGANNVWSQPYAGTDNEGVLTAQEVTQLDMTKTKLVILSACETGLGDIKGSEGVYGLQRAFKMAGVKYIIMSLWQVPDKETVEFMETFYKKLLKEKDVRMAFTETQKEMRVKYDPYYWAAFVLVE